MLKQKKGFTLIELVVTLAIAAILSAFLANIFITIYKVNSTSTDLSFAQIKAQMAMDKITSQIRYANTFNIDASLPNTLSQDTYYLVADNGLVKTKQSGASDVVLSPDANTSEYSYNVSFTKVNSKVVEISLFVLKSNSVIYNIKSKVFINNLISNNITGVSTGNCISYKLTVESAVNVSSITVTSPSDFINSIGQTLQMSANVLPSNATNKSVAWTVDKQDYAMIDQQGILSPLKNGSIIVTATALDGSGIFGTKQIVISNQDIKITNLSLTTSTGETTLKRSGRTMTIITNITPSNASNKEITWSVDNTSFATIDSNGVLTSGGTSGKSVIVTARTNDGSGITATIQISITK